MRERERVEKREKEDVEGTRYKPCMVCMHTQTHILCVHRNTAQYGATHTQNVATSRFFLKGRVGHSFGASNHSPPTVPVP